GRLVGETSSSGMGGALRCRPARPRARRIQRAGDDLRGPLRALSHVPPLRARCDAVRHARQGGETLRVGVKPYPCCHYNHAYLDCLLALRREHEIEPDSIEGIECLVPAGGVPIVWGAARKKREP